MKATSESKSRFLFPAEYDEARYWERVKRNLGWLGDTEEEQKKRQEMIANSVVAIAGCGGIGGSVAVRLARLGVRHLRIADPDTFDLSNINRQIGATIGNVGKNKARVLAEFIYEMTGDVEVEVYEEGITAKNADEFVSGCDYLLDKIDFHDVKYCYALHRAFRNHPEIRYVLKTPVIGHRLFVFKYTHDSMKVEDFYDLPDNGKLTEDVAKRLTSRLAPELPDYPSQKTLNDWFVGNKCAPILSNCPPIAEGIVATQLILSMTGLESLPGVQSVPVQPGYMMFDAMRWETKVVEGKWWS